MVSSVLDEGRVLKEVRSVVCIENNAIAESLREEGHVKVVSPALG